MRIETLALLVVAVSLPVLACADLGCTEMGCESQAVFQVPAALADSQEAAVDFCSRVSGTLVIDDQAYPISPGDWPQFEYDRRRWRIGCGLADRFYIWGVEPDRAVVVLELGYTAQYEVALELVDTDGTRIAAARENVSYERSQPNGDGCGPICRIARAELREVE